jgi:hypothetical protein
MWRNAYGRGFEESAKATIVDTKTFVLQSGEVLVWRVNMVGKSSNVSRTLSCYPLLKECFFTKYRAFADE